MTKEEYYKKMAHLLMPIKALADTYEEGCEFLSVTFYKNSVTFQSDYENENRYTVHFEMGRDIDNAKVVEDGFIDFLLDEGF